MKPDAAPTPEQLKREAVRNEVLKGVVECLKPRRHTVFFELNRQSRLVGVAADVDLDGLRHGRGPGVTI